MGGQVRRGELHLELRGRQPDCRLRAGAGLPSKQRGAVLHVSVALAPADWRQRGVWHLGLQGATCAAEEGAGGGGRELGRVWLRRMGS